MKPADLTIMTKFSIRIPAVKAAVIPKSLTMRWMAMCPEDTMHCCRVVGMDSRRASAACFRWNRNSPLPKRRMGYLRNIYTTLTTADRAWAITVAMATPGTSQWKQTTNTRSSTILVTDDTSRKYSVAAESPRERRMKATML